MNLLKKIDRVLKQVNITYAQVSYLNSNETMLDKTVVVTGRATGIGYAIAKNVFEKVQKLLWLGDGKNVLSKLVRNWE